MKTIKFRTWDSENKELIQFEKIRILPDETLVSDIFEGERYIWTQFTGLHDKNGKEIYEGDIVTDGVGKYKIIYDLKLAGYQPYCIFRDDPENYCEVIGNIYENPELTQSSE